MAKEIEQTKAELVKVVREFAARNYEKDGWDILVECWSDADIEKALGRSKKASGAVWAVKQHLAAVHEQRAAVLAEVF